MDKILEELLRVSSDDALRFFFYGLKGVSKKKAGDEMLYVASVLAHYAQTSRYDCQSMPVLANLREVYERFILLETNDPEICEIGGTQILLFAGFFRDQMSRRHNVSWYDKLGQSLYYRASCHSKETKQRKLFENMSESLPYWTTRCQALSRECRDNRFIIRIE